MPIGPMDDFLAHQTPETFEQTVEEVIRMLIERGDVEHRDDRWVAAESIGAVRIPDNLHSLLLARIDALPPDARHALLVASVIGRTFDETVLQHVLEPVAP